MELTLTEAAGYLSQALGKTVTARQLRPGNALSIDYTLRASLRMGPDEPRLVFTRDHPFGSTWGSLGGVLVLHCDTEAELSIFRLALKASSLYDIGSNRGPAADVAILRALLTTELGWTLREDEEAALQRAALARDCDWPYKGLELRQERPGGRVTVCEESVRAVAAAVPALLEAARVREIASAREWITELRGYGKLERWERRMLRQLEEAYGAELESQTCAA